MGYSADVRRNPDGSIDFNYYRRRAARERRIAQRNWFKRSISAVMRLLAAFAAAPERALGNSAKPCCSPGERAVCCA